MKPLKNLNFFFLTKVPKYGEKNEASKVSFKSFALRNSCRIFNSRERFHKFYQGTYK